MENSGSNDKWPRNTIGQILDTADGSGDVILEFPDGLMETAGWKIGDEIELDKNERGEIIMRKRNLGK